jgi:ATP-binding cassette subfamily B protein
MFMVVVVSALPARLLARSLRPHSARAFGRVRSCLGSLLASLTEYFHYHRPLRHLLAQRFMEDRVSALLQRYHSDQKRAELFSAGVSAAIEVWATLSLAVSLGAGAWLLVENWLTVGELVASIFLVQLLLTGPVQAVAEMFNSLQNAGAASERLLERLREPSRLMLEERVASAEENCRHGELLRFENVTHGYGGPSASLSLCGASFSLASGSTTALVGRSGSGKSTIARLMAGMLVPRSGWIIVTGKPRRLSDIVTLVPDDVQLFMGSLRNNLSYPSHPRSDDEIFHALEKLSLTRWLTTFESGLDTDVTTEALDLADRQRIALVRTLIVSARTRRLRRIVVGHVG